MWKRDRSVLVGAFTAAVVIANVLSAKILRVGPFTVPAGIICYAATFLIGDVIGELYGKNAEMEAVFAGTLSQTLATLLIYLSIVLPGEDAEFSATFAQVLQNNGWFVVSSVFAFAISQSLDTHLFARLKAKTNGTKKWLRNNVSTIISQIVDSTVYVGIAMGIGQGYLWTGRIGIMAEMIISQIIIKTVLALCDTPFFYLLTRRNNNGSNRD